ncbi:MAG: hypothetical protein ACE5FA_08885 [Dehalococcoidia bacterium]
MNSSQRRGSSSVRPWRLLSSHGLALFWISLRPGCTVAEISDGLSLTPRSVWGTVGDLRRAGMVNVRKDGRRHYYSVNYEGTVGRSIVPGGGKLRHVLRFLAERALRNLDEDERSGRDSQGGE